MFPPQKLATWSKMESASRMPPSAFSAITCSASVSHVMPSLWATYSRCFTMSATVMRWKSKIWHRLRMVGRILCFSVVAKMKMACAGGSSSVFRKALKAAVESMCTSSMINTL